MAAEISASVARSNIPLRMEPFRALCDSALERFPFEVEFPVIYSFPLDHYRSPSTPGRKPSPFRSGSLSIIHSSAFSVFQEG